MQVLIVDLILMSAVSPRRKHLEVEGIQIILLSVTDKQNHLLVTSAKGVASVSQTPMICIGGPGLHLTGKSLVTGGKLETDFFARFFQDK